MEYFLEFWCAKCGEKLIVGISTKIAGNPKSQDGVPWIAVEPCRNCMKEVAAIKGAGAVLMGRG
jgi:hypothetical protein